MPEYEVVITTTNRLEAITWDHVHIQLFGEVGESKCKAVSAERFLESGSVLKGTVDCKKSIGKLVRIELNKTAGLSSIIAGDWFPATVDVKSPEGETFRFPINHWITNNEVHEFREATARLEFDDKMLCVRKTRACELKLRKEQYRWNFYAEGIPHCMKIDDVHGLPYEVQFSFTKETEFNISQGLKELKLDGLADCKEEWKSIDAIGTASHKGTPLSEYVQKNWKEDSLFGYQFLNGVNPMVIRRCSKLPVNFPVTDQMVFRHGGRSLAEEMQVCDSPEW